MEPEIMELNDDCWYMIFRLLSLKEQLPLTKVCIQFRNIIVDLLWKNKYSRICLRDSEHFSSKSDKDIMTLNKEEFMDFFKLNVENIKQLVIFNPTQRAFNSYLGRYTDRPDFSFYLYLEYPQLLELACLDKSIHDGHVRLIKDRCIMLEKLCLSSKYVTGHYIAEMKNLTHLIFRDCNLKFNNLQIINSNLCNLKLLSITENDAIIGSNEQLKEFAANIKELELTAKRFLTQIQNNQESINHLLRIKIILRPFVVVGLPTFVWGQFFKCHHKKITSFKISAPYDEICEIIIPHFPLLYNFVEDLDVDGFPAAKKSILYNFKLLRKLSLAIGGDGEISILDQLIMNCPFLEHIHIIHHAFTEDDMVIAEKIMLARLTATKNTDSRPFITLKIEPNRMKTGNEKVNQV